MYLLPSSPRSTTQSGEARSDTCSMRVMHGVPLSSIVKLYLYPSPPARISVVPATFESPCEAVANVAARMVASIEELRLVIVSDTEEESKEILLLIWVADAESSCLISSRSAVVDVDKSEIAVVVELESAAIEEVLADVSSEMLASKLAVAVVRVDKICARSVAVEPERVAIEEALVADSLEMLVSKDAVATDKVDKICARSIAVVPERWAMLFCNRELEARSSARISVLSSRAEIARAVIEPEFSASASLNA